MYIISGEFKVKDEHKDALKQMSLDLIPLSEKEDGCISYRFLEDQANPGHFLFFERWISRDDITGHFEKLYFQDFAKRFPDMIEGDAIIEIHNIASSEKL